MGVAGAGDPASGRGAHGNTAAGVLHAASVCHTDTITAMAEAWCGTQLLISAARDGVVKVWA